MDTPTQQIMLEALEETRDWFELWLAEIGPAEQALLRRVNAAIAKATEAEPAAGAAIDDAEENPRWETIDRYKW